MRKVRAGWYTETVVDFEDVLEKRAKSEFHVDVSRSSGVRVEWVVSYRRSHALLAGRPGCEGYEIAYFEGCKEAKAFAAAVAESYRDRTDLPNAKTFDEYAIIRYRFEKCDEWKTVLEI